MQWIRRCKQEENTLVDSIAELKNLDEEQKRLYALFMKQRAANMPKGPLEKKKEKEMSEAMGDYASYKS